MALLFADAPTLNITHSEEVEDEDNFDVSRELPSTRIDYFQGGAFNTAFNSSTTAASAPRSPSHAATLTNAPPSSDTAWHWQESNETSAISPWAAVDSPMPSACPLGLSAVDSAVDAVSDSPSPTYRGRAGKPASPLEKLGDRVIQQFAGPNARRQAKGLFEHLPFLNQLWPSLRILIDVIQNLWGDLCSAYILAQYDQFWLAPYLLVLLLAYFVFVHEVQNDLSLYTCSKKDVKLVFLPHLLTNDRNPTQDIITIPDKPLLYILRDKPEFRKRFLTSVVSIYVALAIMQSMLASVYTGPSLSTLTGCKYVVFTLFPMLSTSSGWISLKDSAIFTIATLVLGGRVVCKWGKYVFKKYQASCAPRKVEVTAEGRYSVYEFETNVVRVPIRYQVWRRDG